MLKPYEYSPHQGEFPNNRSTIFETREGALSLLIHDPDPRAAVGCARPAFGIPWILP